MLLKYDVKYKIEEWHNSSTFEDCGYFIIFDNIKTRNTNDIIAIRSDGLITIYLNENELKLMYNNKKIYYNNSSENMFDFLITSSDRDIMIFNMYNRLKQLRNLNCYFKIQLPILKQHIFNIMVEYIREYDDILNGIKI